MIWVIGNISEADKAFWGSVTGALLGTIGAFLIAVFAIWADRRKRRSQNDKNDLRQYNRRSITAEIALNEYVTAMLKSSRLLKKIAADKTPGSYMMTLPRTLELSTENIENFRNPELVDNWLTMTIRAKIVNQLIEDFTDYYKMVRDSVFSLQLKNEQLKVPFVANEQTILASFAGDTNKAVEGAIDSAIRVLAMLQLHGEMGRSKDKKFKNPKELEAFKLSYRKIESKAKKLNKFYDPKRVFQDLNSSSP